MVYVTNLCMCIVHVCVFVCVCMSVCMCSWVCVCVCEGDKENDKVDTCEIGRAHV